MTADDIADFVEYYITQELGLTDFNSSDMDWAEKVREEKRFVSISFVN